MADVSASVGRLLGEWIARQSTFSFDGASHLDTARFESWSRDEPSNGADLFEQILTRHEESTDNPGAPSRSWEDSSEEPSDGFSWEDLADVCAALNEGVAIEPESSESPPATLRAIGRELIQDLVGRASLARALADVGSIPDLLQGPIARVMLEVFPDLTFVVRHQMGEPSEDGPRDVLVIEASLPESLEGCRPFFELVQGLIEACPLLISQDPIEAEAKISGMSGRYRLVLPVAAETSAARDPSGDGSFDLASFAATLGRLTRVDDFAELLFDVLSVQFGCPAASLWLEPDEPDATRTTGDLFLFREWGESVKPPSRNLRLGVGDRLLGRIDLWDPDDFSDDFSEALDELLTLLAMALDAIRYREQLARTAAAFPGRPEADTQTSAPAPDVSVPDADRIESILEASRAPALLIDREGRILSSNSALRALMGPVALERIDDDLMSRIDLDDREILAHLWFGDRPPEGMGSTEFRLRRDGQNSWQTFEAHWLWLDSEVDPPMALISLCDTSERQQVDGLLPRVHPNLAVADDDIYVALLRHLGEHLDACHSVLAVLDADTDPTLRVIASWQPGVDRDHATHAPATIELNGSPCAKPLGGRFFAQPDGLRDRFPHATDLPGTEEADGFMAVPLKRQDQSVLGILACWRHGPEPDLVRARALIEAVGRRAETELEHRRILELLRVSEERYRMLAENSRDVVAESSVTGVPEYVSPSVSEVLGYSPDEIMAMDARELIHPDDADSAGRAFGEMTRSGSQAEIVYRARHRDGGWRWLDVRARAYRDPNKVQHLVTVSRDVTRLAVAEQERERLRAIIESSPDFIALVSLDGALLSLNTAGQRLIDVASEDEARKRSVYDLLDEGHADAMKFEIMPAVHRRHQWTGELNLLNMKTGRRIATQANLFMIEDAKRKRASAVAIICRDVSASVEAAQALMESEQRCRMLAENPYDLISELDEHGHFIYVSPNFQQILGYAPESLLGRDAIELVHPDDRDKIGPGFQAALADESVSYGGFRILHQDGSSRWVNTTSRAYRMADNRVASVLISRDITDHVESSEALKRTEQKLRQSQKMESIGRLAGGIAHDFNNLLTAITGYCDLLLEELDAHHPGREDAQEILKASERAAGLTHQLLAFSRRQVLQPRVVDLNALVADMDRMLRRLIPEDVELVSLLDGAAWPIKADPSQIQQVLLNLVVNARDAMPRGGRIEIETRNASDEEVAREELPSGGYLVLSISDDGEGIDPATQMMIFEPFYTTKQSGKGTGLGLSTVIGIVQQSGGHIRVESNLGEGAKFIVYLPRAEAVAMLPERHLEPGQFTGSETVLLVEDADSVRKLINRYLTRQGYHVLEAASGQEALHHCNHHVGPIHLLLTDVILPKMDGLEIGAKVCELRPETRVIYMSGFTDDTLMKHGISAEGISLLEKPFAPSTLLRTIREFLDSGVTPAPPPRISPDDDSRGQSDR